MTLSKIVSATLATAMTAILVPAAAHASMDTTVVEAPTQPVAYVKYADLNLASADGVAELNQRVRRAATNICFVRGDLDLTAAMDGRACRDEAVEGAAPQIAAAISKAGDTQVASNASITVALK